MTFPLSEIESLHGQPEQIVSVLADLLASLREDDEELAAGVADVCGSLDSIRPEDSLALIPYCSEDHPVVAAWGCRLLAMSLGQEAEHDAVVERVLAESLTKHENVGVRHQAAIAIGKLQQPSEGTVDALRTAAASEDARLSRLAGRALEQIHDDAA